MYVYIYIRIYVRMYNYIHIIRTCTLASERLWSTPGRKAFVNFTQDEPMAPAMVETIAIAVMICEEMREGGREIERDRK